MKILIDDSMNAAVVLNSAPAGEDYMEEVISDGENAIKDPLLSGWPFVIGISFLSIALGLVLGVFLGKRRIKKGIDID